jgi:hypothetical protein
MPRDFTDPQTGRLHLLDRLKGSVATLAGNGW